MRNGAPPAWNATAGRTLVTRSGFAFPPQPDRCSTRAPTHLAEVPFSFLRRAIGDSPALAAGEGASPQRSAGPRSPAAAREIYRAARPHCPRCRATPFGLGFALGGMPAAGAEDPMFDVRSLLDQLLRGDPRSQDRRPPSGSEDLADLLAQLASHGGQGALPEAGGRPPGGDFQGSDAGPWAFARRRAGTAAYRRSFAALSASASPGAGMSVSSAGEGGLATSWTRCNGRRPRVVGRPPRCPG
jgi:hypothetical protein